MSSSRRCCAQPGRFTYVRPPDYIGNTFVQSVLYAFNPYGSGAEPFLQSAESFTPETQAASEALLANSEVDMLCQMGAFTAEVRVTSGALPETIENIILPESGMLANKSYLAIPSSAPNPAAALLGAIPRQVLWRVTMPRLLPGIVSATLLTSCAS